MMEAFLRDLNPKWIAVFRCKCDHGEKTNIMASLVVNFVLTHVPIWLAACQQKIVTVHAVYFWTANWKLFVWKQIAYGVIACTEAFTENTVDGRNPAPHWMVETLSIMGCLPPINW